MSDHGHRPPTERESSAGARPPTEREASAGARPPTEREAPGGPRPPTVREDSTGFRPPTEREMPPGPASWVAGGHDEGRPAGRVQRGGPGPEGYPVPPGLSSRFRGIRPLPGGGEADVTLVEDIERGGRVVLKTYRYGTSLDEDSLWRIRDDVAHDHVVKLHEWGTIPGTQQWYEVQEHVEAGSLADLVDEHPQGITGDLFADIVRELSDAVTAFHYAGLVHHDINPRNVLVRSLQPQLDLVLCDFGLAITAGHTVMLSRGGGTIAYNAPEALKKQGGPARDYWALGMTIAEIAGGRHPFRHPDDRGRWLSDHSIMAHLFDKRPIDLSAVADERARLLCQGLTRYDTRQRWAADQVTEWLAGGSPAVADETPLERRPAAGFEFAGEIAENPSSLASLMGTQWREAQRLLGSPSARHAFLDRVGETFRTIDGALSLAELDDEWGTTPPGDDRAVADAIVALDRHATPVFRGSGTIVTQDGLAELAAQALAGGSDATRARSTIDALYNQHILPGYARAEDHAALADIDSRWRAATAAFDTACADARADGISGLDTDTVRATLLLACVDADEARRLARERDHAARESREARRFSWYSPLAKASPNQPGAVLAARLLALPAAQEARRLNFEADRESRQAAGGTASALRTWLRWPILASVLIAGGLGYAEHRRQDLIEAVWTEAAKGSDWADRIITLLEWSPRWPVWAVVAVVGLAAWWVLRGQPSPTAVRTAQAAAVVTTLATPPLVPFGVRRAFLTRSARQNGAGRPKLRRNAVLGGSVTVLTLLGLVAEANWSTFGYLFDAWPEGVQAWYLAHWPTALRPEELNQHFSTLAIGGAALAACGLGGAWLSYEHADSDAVRALQLVGGVGGMAAGVAALPVLLTGTAGFLFIVLAVGAGIAAVAVVLWFLVMTLDST
jgi:eukaryotic-like serine/threonine-protein kinase